MTIYVGDIDWQFVSEKDIFEWEITVSMPQRVRIIGTPIPPDVSKGFFVDTNGFKWEQDENFNWVRGG